MFSNPLSEVKNASLICLETKDWLQIAMYVPGSRYLPQLERDVYFSEIFPSPYP